MGVGGGGSLLKIADICSVVVNYLYFFFSLFLLISLFINLIVMIEAYVLALQLANFSVKIALIMFFTTYNIAIIIVNSHIKA